MAFRDLIIKCSFSIINVELSIIKFSFSIINPFSRSSRMRKFEKTINSPKKACFEITGEVNKSIYYSDFRKFIGFN